MSLYIGYYYGDYLKAKKYFLEEDIEDYFDGKGILKEVEKKFGFETNSTEDGVQLFIAKKVFRDDNYYDCYYSGGVQGFSVQKIVSFENNEKQTVENELQQKFLELKNFLEEKGIEEFPNKLLCGYFSHTVS